MPDAETMMTTRRLAFSYQNFELPCKKNYATFKIKRRGRKEHAAVYCGNTAAFLAASKRQRTTLPSTHVLLESVHTGAEVPANMLHEVQENHDAGDNRIGGRQLTSKAHCQSSKIEN